jgi:hypothetical protein
MLAASDAALEGREFDDLSEIDRAMTDAHIGAVVAWLQDLGMPTVANVLAREQLQGRMTECNAPSTSQPVSFHHGQVGGEAAVSPAGKPSP